MYFWGHQALSRLVAEKNLSVRANDDDSSRTAVDQDIQLLFRFLPPHHLVPQFVGVALEYKISVANKLRNEQSRANEADRAKYEVCERLILGQIAEIKNSAQQGDDDNEFARQEPCCNHDWKQI